MRNEIKGQRRSVFAQRLWAEWKRLGLPTAKASCVVAVSGGADSTALLLACDELTKAQRLALSLTIAHLDHGLRGAAGAEDALWVKSLAEDLGYDVALGNIDVSARASEQQDNLEQAARRARYEFLAEVARERSAQLVLTAHTMDDQAETVIMRLLRGSGAEGLGGMSPIRALINGQDILLARPLLRWARRADTADYCRARGVAFCIDTMNEDERFARVRARRHLLPLLQTFNPRAVESLARAAELLREDAAALTIQAMKLLEEACEPTKTGESASRAADEINAPALRIDVLLSAPAALRRRALRLWIERARGDLRRLTRAHMLAVEKLLEGERGGRVAELPGGARIERRRTSLLYRAKCEN